MSSSLLLGNKIFWTILCPSWYCWYFFLVGWSYCFFCCLSHVQLYLSFVVFNLFSVDISPGWWYKSYKFPSFNRDYSAVPAQYGNGQWIVKNCKFTDLVLNQFGLTNYFVWMNWTWFLFPSFFWATFLGMYDEHVCMFQYSAT